MTVKVHYDGEVFVPDEPVNLPVGSQAKVVVTNSAPVTEPILHEPVKPILKGVDPEVVRAIGQDPEFNIENS